MKEYKKKICAFRKISRAAKDLNVGGEHLHICLFDIYILNAKSVFFLAISFILSLNTKYRWFPLHFAPVDRIFYFRFITTVSLFLWPLNWIRITRKLYNFKDLCANVMWLVIFLLKFLRCFFYIAYCGTISFDCRCGSVTISLLNIGNRFGNNNNNNSTNSSCTILYASCYCPLSKQFQ